MTNPKIPEWFQAAIAKLNEKYAEKRQTFKERGDRYHDGFADGLDTAETIFMSEFEHAEPQSDWISVADRLPPENELVLVNYYFDDDEEDEYNFAIDFLEDGEWQDTPNTWEYSRITITHWQPLPLPPQAE